MADLPAAPAAPAMPKMKPPGKIKKFFGWIIGIPRRLWRLSLAAKAAWLSAFALLVVVAIAWMTFFVEPESVPWRHAMTPGRVIAVVCLLILIPLVVYRVLKLWLEGDTSRFPDLDFAWRAGVTALERNGVDLATVPIYLVLGAASERQERLLFDAAGLGLRVHDVPEGPAPLHWYAGPEAVFLCCTEASWMSALSAFDATRALTEMASSLTSLESPTASPYMPAAADQPAMAYQPQALAAPQQAALPAPRPAAMPAATAPMPGGGNEDIRGTIMLGQYAAGLAAQASQAPMAQPLPPQQAPVDLNFGIPPQGGGPAGAAEESGPIGGTMMLQAPIQLPNRQAVAPRPVVGAAPPTFTAAQRQASVLSPQESAEQLERLQHVCTLLRRARQPLCAINGVLALLPLTTVQGSPREVDELQRAAKSDLRTIGRTLELRCPVTALVVGLEQEAGFRELVRRVGRDRAAVQRFGQRYDVRSQATAEEMNALCADVCGAFEDWVYTLFREQGALSRPGQHAALWLAVQGAAGDEEPAGASVGRRLRPRSASEPTTIRCYSAAATLQPSEKLRTARLLPKACSTNCSKSRSRWNGRPERCGTTAAISGPPIWASCSTPASCCSWEP